MTEKRVKHQWGNITEYKGTYSTTEHRTCKICGLQQHRTKESNTDLGAKWWKGNTRKNGKTWMDKTFCPMEAFR